MGSSASPVSFEAADDGMLHKSEKDPLITAPGTLHFGSLSLPATAMRRCLFSIYFGGGVSGMCVY